MWASYLTIALNMQKSQFVDAANDVLIENAELYQRLA
jgi:hypothetical protein